MNKEDAETLYRLKRALTNVGRIAEIKEVTRNSAGETNTKLLFETRENCPNTPDSCGFSLSVGGLNRCKLPEHAAIGHNDYGQYIVLSTSRLVLCGIKPELDEEKLS